MNAIILNLNDTTALSDSAVVELVKAVNACQSRVMETETSCNDVIIAAIVCVAIVLVALIAKWAVWSWREAEIRILREIREEKTRNEQIEVKRKMLHTLIEKRIDALKNQAVIKNEKGDITGYKAFDSNEFKAYDNALEKYIGKSYAELK